MTKTTFFAALLATLCATASAPSFGDPARARSERNTTAIEDCRHEAPRRHAERGYPRADGDETGAGAIVGALVGGAIGRQFGSSPDGRNLGTAAGALIGALIGNQIERDAYTHPDGRERAERERRGVRRDEVCRA